MFFREIEMKTWRQKKRDHNQGLKTRVSNIITLGRLPSNKQTHKSNKTEISHYVFSGPSFKKEMKNEGSDETPSNRFAFDSFDAESLSFKFDNLQQLQHTTGYLIAKCAK